MPKNRLGNGTIVYPNAPGVAATASVVGPKENEGPLGGAFDFAVPDAKWDKNSFEEAECAIYQEACRRCAEKAGFAPENVQALLGGDLLNQIMAASLAARALKTPFLGLYGACSTMTESLLLGAMLVDGGYCSNVLCAAGSHFCTAERQYRFPLEYGAQRTPAAQWTVTGAGACLLTDDREAIVRVTSATIGRVIDLGVTDANNMGAAMAPAAADTLTRHFRDTGREPRDYHAIVTGDLGYVGSEALKEMMKRSKMSIDDNHKDGGLLIFDTSQNVNAGGSGCGCMATVLSAYILPRLISGEWTRALIMATGALLSPTTNQQGESIPGVAHAVVLERRK